jgi:hypothetical protein
VWSLRLRESTGARVHALALHAQVRIEPQRRSYDELEQDRLLDLFGEPTRWADTLHPFLWTHVDTMVSGFDGETVVDLPMACTYDFDVAGSKFLHGLEDGEVPLAFLFNGTVFTNGGAASTGSTGFSAEPVPWNLECEYRLPVARWREVMDRYFPGGGWLRLDRGTIDRLQRYRVQQALPTWEQAVAALLKAAGEEA